MIKLFEEFENNNISIPDDVAIWFMDFFAQQTIHFDVDIKSIPNILFQKTFDLVKRETGNSLVYRGETRDWEIKKPIRFSPLNDAGISWSYEKETAMGFIDKSDDVFSYLYTLDLNDVHYPVSMDLIMWNITDKQKRLITNPITRDMLLSYSSEKEILVFDTFYSDILKIERIYD